MIRSCSLPKAGVLTLALVLLAGPLHAQIPGLRDAASRLGNRLPDISGMLQGKPPITTSLQDAKFAVDSLDNFRPDRPEGRLLRIALTGLGIRTFNGMPVDSLDPYPLRAGSVAAVDSLDPFPVRDMLALQRTPSGGFVLQPGYYEMHTQSYCIHAGTHGPGGGDGYLFAPPEGPAEEAVMTILRNSVNHPEIEQQKIQTLLWAIIARAKFEDLSAEHKATASRLMTPQQIAMLNRSALDLVPGPALDRALTSLPPLVRQVVEAEARLRQMLINPTTSFAELERVAVLAGAVGMGPGSREVPTGRWSRHPDGYYVRYLPQSYSHTVMQVWVPKGSPAVGKELDPAMHIAIPGNTARQRLIQSGRPRQQT
ncbi:MAG TPA: hypothetical protein VGR37_04365 [Longimicrobiaceae bacterium]|nr:hypothetical protein [Longimicrobiaceae bacterium]